MTDSSHIGSIYAYTKTAKAIDVRLEVSWNNNTVFQQGLHFLKNHFNFSRRKRFHKIGEHVKKLQFSFGEIYQHLLQRVVIFSIIRREMVNDSKWHVCLKITSSSISCWSTFSMTVVEKPCCGVELIIGNCSFYSSSTSIAVGILSFYSISIKSNKKLTTCTSFPFSPNFSFTSLLKLILYQCMYVISLIVSVTFKSTLDVSRLLQ